MIRVSAKALILRDGAILVIENRNPDVFYTLPGGGQEPGESLPQTLARECREELQVSIVVHDLILARDYIAAHHEFAHLHPDVHQIELIFACSLSPGEEPRRALHGDDHQTGFAWLPVSELDDAPLFPRCMLPAVRAYCNGETIERTYLGDVN